jgi:hypothetical protein
MRKAFRLDLTGHTYGRWTVLSFSHKNARGEIYWLCRCECGEERAVKANGLRSGKSASCGCLHKEKVSIHGMTGTPTFRSWETMKQRCTNPKSPDYEYYGGRGISVCDAWLNSFETFLSDMGERPNGATLDRVETDGDYEPGNCRWATYRQQVRNRRDTVTVSFRGKTQDLYQWEAETGISARAIRQRIKAGWLPDKALTTPINTNLSRKR